MTLPELVFVHTNLPLERGVSDVHHGNERLRRRRWTISGDNWVIVSSTSPTCAKLTVHYVPQRGLDRASLGMLLAECLPDASSIALTLIPVPGLRPIDARLSVLAVAVHDSGGNTIAHESVRLAETLSDPFHCGVSCGGFVFVAGQLADARAGEHALPASLVAQNRAVLDRLSRILAHFELTPDHIIKFNTWRAPPPDDAEYAAAAAARFDYLNEVACAVTGITVPDLDQHGALIQIDAWAVAGRRGTPLDPPGHWDWPAPNPYVQGAAVGQWVFVGGQASLDSLGTVVQPGDFDGQLQRTSEFVRRVASFAGASETDIELACTYACESIGGHVQSSRLMRTGPCAQVAHLAYPGQLVEIDAIARREASSIAVSSEET